MGCADYFQEPQDIHILKTCVELFRKVNKFPDALRVAIRLGDADLIRTIYDSCEDVSVKKQLGFTLARHRLFTVVTDDERADILNHTVLSESFLALARDLDIVEAKTPDDIYKSHLNDSRMFCIITTAHTAL